MLRVVALLALRPTMQLSRAPRLLAVFMGNSFLPSEMKTYFRADAGPQADDVAA